MGVLAIVVPIALLMGGLSLYVFIRCARGGQYDDLDTPPLRMLTDEEAVVEGPSRPSRLRR